MLDDALHFLANGLGFSDWERLGQHLPFDWIEEAVVCTHSVSIRHRRLPAEQVLWLVIALALHWSMSGLVILMTLAGGMGRLVGPILDAFIIIALESKLGDLGTFLARSTASNGFPRWANRSAWSPA
jgi:hypothetical protein